MTAQANQTNIPKLRFPEFKGAWDDTNIGDLYSFCSTNSFSRNDLQSEQTSIANIHYGDIHTGFKSKFIFKNEIVPYVQNDIIGKIKNNTFVEKGDLIFADASEDTADIGKMIEIIDLNEARVVSGLHTIHAKPKDRKNLAHGFMADLFKTTRNRRAIIRESQGAKVLGISSKKIEKIKINVPKKEEQQKIASFLGALDDKIAGLQKKKNLLEAYKKGMMQRLFSQSLRFTDPNGNPFPDWDEKKLGDLKLYISDGNYGEMYPKANQMVSSGIPFIRANNLREGRLIWKDMKFIEPELHAILTSGHLKDQDILVTTRGDIGTIALVSTDFEGANINAQICLIRCENNMIPAYLFHYLSLESSHRQFKSLQTGSALKQLPKGNLAKVIIHYPHPGEQKKIADFLSAIDDKIALVASELSHAKTFKKGLLQQMFV